MHFFRFFFISISLGIFLNKPLPESAGYPEVRNLLDKAFAVNSQIRSVQLTLLASERIDGEIIKKKTDFKIDYSPFKLYARQQYPKEGMEALYPENALTNKVLINWSKISFLNLRFEPTSKTIRKGTHHSIYKAGFSFILEVIKDLHNKYDTRDREAWKLEGMVKYADIVCYKLIFENPDFHFLEYTLKDGETLEDLTNRFKICDYMILENNPELRGIDDFTAGSRIKLPSDYAKRIILYLNRETMLPVGIKAYDDKGLFEEYTYLDTEINPVFGALEFDSSNPDYGFR